MLYKNCIRPLLFKYTDPENIHETALILLDAVSKNFILKKICLRLLQMHDNRLRISIGHLRLANPVGLAAGFDKNITAPLAYPMLGFGWVEFGSITYSAQEGNLKPRLWRLPKDRGLIVHYGLANDGAQRTLERYNEIQPHSIPYGISIAPTNGLSGPAMAEDYLKTFLAVESSADYITLNVSCPNVAGESIFSQLSFIKLLLTVISTRQKMIESRKDIFIKIGSRLSDADLAKIVEYALDAKITGIIATNLIKDRSDMAFESTPEELNHPGGISGKPLQAMSTRTIRTLYRLSKGKLKIIGVGGIFTAEDAYHKIKAGATAVQLVTGFIYGGPAAISAINKGLIRLMTKDGFKNISEAVGTEA